MPNGAGSCPDFRLVEGSSLSIRRTLTPPPRSVPDEARLSAGPAHEDEAAGGGEDGPHVVRWEGPAPAFFRAFDAESGEELWRFRTNSGIIGIPTSFAVDGRQYIAVQSGWGARAQRLQDHIDQARGTRTEVPRGGMIWVFALKP